MESRAMPSGLGQAWNVPIDLGGGWHRPLKMKEARPRKESAG